MVLASSLEETILYSQNSLNLCWITVRNQVCAQSVKPKTVGEGARRLRAYYAHTARRCAQVGEECAPTPVRSGEELDMRAVCAQPKKKPKNATAVRVGARRLRVDCAQTARSHY